MLLPLMISVDFLYSILSVELKIFLLNKNNAYCDGISHQNLILHSSKLAGVASGATRAALTQHFALQNNAADISAKV